MTTELAMRLGEKSLIGAQCAPRSVLVQTPPPGVATQMSTGLAGWIAIPTTRPPTFVGPSDVQLLREIPALLGGSGPRAEISMALRCAIASKRPSGLGLPDSSIWVRSRNCVRWISRAVGAAEAATASPIALASANAA